MLITRYRTLEGMCLSLKYVQQSICFQNMLQTNDRCRELVIQREKQCPFNGSFRNSVAKHDNIGDL